MPAQSVVEIVLRGSGVSPGIALGPIVLDSDVFEEPLVEPLAGREAGVEWERFMAGVEATKGQLRALRDKVAAETGTENAFIFDAHLLMLEDNALLQQVEKKVRQQEQCSEGAFWSVMTRYMDSMRRMDDAYLKERVADLEDIARRVVRVLRGEETGVQATEPHILVAVEISPSETASMDRKLVRGFASETGSQTSHSTIMARSMGIPAVAGLTNLTSHSHPGTMALLDGYRGLLILNPTSETIREYTVVRRQKEALDKVLHGMADLPAVTPDGRKFVLAANIEFAHETAGLRHEGAEGVGLYRTEFLYLNRRDLPSEEEQTADYTAVIVGAGPEGAIIRTLDIGGDKLHDLHDDLEESNPFLGWRGIRVSLTKTDIFKAQIRAILRAGVHGPVKILLPMVSTVDEIRDAQKLINECRQELAQEGLAYNPGVPVGAMIEVPSAAVIADMLAREVDFFSIGTNDLIQYTMAVDRGNELVANLYQPTSPAIVRLLKTVAEAGRAAGIHTGVCGEMAGDFMLTPLMVGIGFEELSMSPVQLPYVRFAVRRLPADVCRALVEKAVQLPDAKSIGALCHEVMATYCGELLG